MRVYKYANRRKIVIHDRRDAAGMEVADVIVGLTTLRQGTPYQCLCWLASQGDLRAISQLSMWEQVFADARQRRGVSTGGPGA